PPERHPGKQCMAPLARAMSGCNSCLAINGTNGCGPVWVTEDDGAAVRPGQWARGTMMHRRSPGWQARGSSPWPHRCVPFCAAATGTSRLGSIVARIEHADGGAEGMVEDQMAILG